VGECESSRSVVPFRARSDARPACPRHRGPALLSWGSDTSRSPWSATLSRVLVAKSLFDLDPATSAGLTLEVFAPCSALTDLNLGWATSLRFSVPFRVSPSVLARPQPRSGRSPGVLSPSAPSAVRSPLTPGLPHPVRCAFRLSQPPGAFLLRTPPGLLSCR
jgi:hypothetical protein